MSITVSEFGRLSSGKAVLEYTLKNADGCGFSFLDWGGYVRRLWVKDKNGQLRDVCLGFDHVSDYENGPNGCAGAIIGRVGNRIGGASFDLDGVHYTLAANDHGNNLHSGPEGFHRRHWDVEIPDADSFILHYLSPDGEMGFPGKLDVCVRYRFANNALCISYRAVTDKPTLCNMTNHTYFNLNGEGDIRDHVLQINACCATEVTEELIPTGRFIPVKQLPYDFSEPIAIRKQLSRLEEDKVYALHKGVDFNFCTREGGARKQIADVYSPESGIGMKVFTTEPGVQCYMAMGFHCTGKNGSPYEPYAGLALETQHYPDAPHHDNFPSIVLRPGEVYESETEYAFDVR